MKFCPNCGKQLTENSKFCSNCGKEIIKKEENKTQEVVNTTNINNNESNPLAITGFIISLVSMLCCGSTSWLGLLFSIIGLVESKKKNDSGRKLAIAGIIISAILIVLLLLLYVFSISSSISEIIKSSTKLPGYYY